MSGFESSSFKKNVPSTGNKQLREFTVGAPEEHFEQESNFESENFRQSNMSPEDMEMFAREARKAKANPNVRIGDAAKKRIELLADIGRLTKDVQIGSYSFSLRTLKAKEAREAALATFTSVNTQLEASYEARKQQLARSIYKIDGHEVAFVLGNDTLDARFEFVESLEEVIANMLFDEFTLLKEESKKQYGLNTVKDVEEVSEDLKK